MRGLYRHPAKVLSVEIWTVGSNPTPSTKYYSRVAQSVEQDAVNVLVGSSSLSSGAKQWAVGVVGGTRALQA